MCYLFIFLGLFLYSFTQIDLGLVISRFPFFYQIEKAFQYIGYFNRPLSTVFYLFIVVGLTILYLIFLQLAAKKKIEKRYVWKIIFTGIILLVFSYNAFSYDLFNYLFDAKIITHYHANPYIHTALDYPGDPMLAFMHWTHRVYPYGPVWLVLTVPLSFIGLQLFLPTFFLFKFLMVASYVGSVYYIGKIFKKIKPEREIFGLIFFGLNPLVLIESLVSAHIDIVMMFFSLMAFSLLHNKRYIFSYGSLLLSIGIKFLTGLLLPIFFVIHVLKLNNKKINWDLIFGFSLLLFIAGVIIESRQSGNFQPWYLLGPMAFTVFLSHKYYIFIPSVVVSVVSLLLYVPYLYLGNWNPPVPQILSYIMFVSYGISIVLIGVYSMIKKQKIRSK
ncbi:MAG TPA: hypothetical protein VND99_01080 [Candidatus Acidoferrales bacterium]|nr:hypothetical protein [Candidatus Acidoferrales bacterium]